MGNCFDKGYQGIETGPAIKAVIPSFTNQIRNITFYTDSYILSFDKYLVKAIIDPDKITDEKIAWNNGKLYRITIDELNFYCNIPHRKWLNLKEKARFFEPPMVENNVRITEFSLSNDKLKLKGFQGTINFSLESIIPGEEWFTNNFITVKISEPNKIYQLWLTLDQRRLVTAHLTSPYFNKAGQYTTIDGVGQRYFIRYGFAFTQPMSFEQYISLSESENNNFNN